MAKFDMTEIRGVIPAMLTCFDENGAVDLQRQRDLTEFLIDAGVDGLYLTGSTGLCFTMTAEERMQVAEAVIQQAAGRIPIIVHVGDIGTEKSILLARHAEAAGADAISSVPPFYWGFSADAIYHYYEDIANAVSIPMVVYNIALAGLMDLSLIRRIASIPNVRGLKYTARTHDEMGALKLELGPDFMIYSGCDEMAFSGLAFGADGLIGSYYNVIPELYHDIFTCAVEGDLPRGMQLQKLADAFILCSLRHNTFMSIYDLLRMRGFDAGYPRRPFLHTDADTLRSLEAELRQIRTGFGTDLLDRFLR